jgi:hypothetical protein
MLRTTVYLFRAGINSLEITPSPIATLAYFPLRDMNAKGYPSGYSAIEKDRFLETLDGAVWLGVG